MHKKILLLALAVGTMQLFGAEHPAKTDTVKTYTFDPVVVTGTNGDVLRSALPNTISVISLEKIQESGETSLLPILNKRVPGLFITERGVLGYGVSNGAAGSISIRGNGGSPNTEVLVMTDGRPQMMGLMGHPLPDTYVSSDVERIEIIRGPASLLHGTNAMGGVINIITEKFHTPGTHYHAAGSYGSYGTQKLEAGMAEGFDGGGFSVSGNHYQTDGHRAFSSFWINDGSVKTNVALNDRLTFIADASISDFKTFDPGMESAPFADHWIDITRGSSGFAVENRFDKMHGALKFFYNGGRHDLYDGFHSTDNNIGILLYQGIQFLPDNITTVGVDYKHFGGAAENRKSHADFGGHGVDETGAYALVQQTVAERITVNGGLRVNYGNLYGSEIVPQIGTAVRIDSLTTVKATVSKGFRSPTIRELYLFPAPTPTLKPERLWNYEIGLLHSFTSFLSMELAGYISEGSNIIRAGGAFPNLSLSNSGAFVHRGIEFSGDLSLPGKRGIELTYSYLDPGDQTMANPRHKLYVGGRYSFETMTLTAGIQHIERLYGADFGRQPLPDYTIVNARVTWMMNEMMTLFLSGENLTGQKYSVMYGYPMPGATVLAGLNFRTK